MRRREVIQLFSTSSIDLLACGLGAVLVLWLLVFGNQGGALEGEQPLGSGELRIRQYGLSHLQGFTLTDYVLASYKFEDNQDAPVTNPSNFDPELSFRDRCNDSGLKPRFTAIYVRPGSASKIEISCKASDAFAKEVVIRFTDMKSAHDVGFVIQTCNADEIHYLEMQTIDRRGVSNERYVFHCHNAAHQALDDPPTSPWEKHFRTAIKNELALMCPPDGWETPFHYRVYNCTANMNLDMTVRFTSDGAVRFRAPDPNGTPARLDTINGKSPRERVVDWAGGTYGDGRVPAGLPACTP